MEVGDIFKENIKILRGFNVNREPIIEDGVIDWEVIKVYDKRHFLAKNKDGDLKVFSI